MKTTLANTDQTVGTPTKTKDVWLVYTPVSNGKAFVDALSALYYLPEHYKLIVSGVIEHMPSVDKAIMDRVKIAKTETELSEKATPFAFIYGARDKSDVRLASKKTPTVIVTDQPEQYIKENEWDGFTVATGAPEALASAIMDIARTSLYNGIRLIQQPLAR